MYGLEAINAHNGWAMALTGAIIVMTGRTVLSTIISQLHRIVDMMQHVDHDHHIQILYRKHRVSRFSQDGYNIRHILFFSTVVKGLQAAFGDVIGIDDAGVSHPFGQKESEMASPGSRFTDDHAGSDTD